MKLNEKEAKALKRRIRVAEKYYKDKREADMKRALSLYTGIHYENMKSPSRRNRIIVNYILDTVEDKTHANAARHVQLQFQPEDREAHINLEVTEVVVPYEYRKARAQYEAKRALKDSYIYGNGYVYTGWLFTTTTGTRMEDGRQPVEGEEQDTTPNPPNFGAEPQVPQQLVDEDRFFVKRISPKNFFVSPECGRNLEEAEYCGYWECRALDEVKADQRYKNTRSLKGSSDNLKGYFDKTILEEFSGGEEHVATDMKRVKLFHYYEKKRRLYALFCDEHDKPLYISEWGWDWQDYPFRTLIGPGDEDDHFGQPLTLLLEHIQKEINESRSQLADIRRTSQAKYQVAGGQLTAKTIKQLQDTGPNTVVEHNGTIPASIVPIAQQPVQPAIFQTEEACLRDIQTLAARSQYQLGNAPSKRTTSSEVEAIQSQGGARAKNDQQEFERFCADIAKDCLRWLQQYSVKARSVPVVSDAGKVVDWKDYTREEIRGEYEVQVFANSSTAPNDADKIQSISFFMQSLAPFIQLMPTAMQVGINLNPLLKQLLKALPDIRNVDEILQGMQPQMGGLPPMAPPGIPPGAVSGGDPMAMDAGAGIPQGQPTPEELMMLLQGAPF